MVLLFRRSVGLVDTSLLFRRSVGPVDSNHSNRLASLASCVVPVAWSDIVDFDNFVRPVLWCVCSSVRVS